MDILVVLICSHLIFYVIKVTHVSEKILSNKDVCKVSEIPPPLNSTKVTMLDLVIVIQLYFYMHA